MGLLRFGITPVVREPPTGSVDLDMTHPHPARSSEVLERTAALTTVGPGNGFVGDRAGKSRFICRSNPRIVSR